MDIINLLSLLFGSGILVSLFGYFHKKQKENEKKTEAICKGVQALLRDRLIDKYNKYTERGYAPIYVKDNFDNIYNQYHNLGKNGVMDGLHAEFMALPSERKDNHENQN